MSAEHGAYLLRAMTEPTPQTIDQPNDFFQSESERAVFDQDRKTLLTLAQRMAREQGKKPEDAHISTTFTPRNYEGRSATFRISIGEQNVAIDYLPSSQGGLLRLNEIPVPLPAWLIQPPIKQKYGYEPHQTVHIDSLARLQETPGENLVRAQIDVIGPADASHAEKIVQLGMNASHPTPLFSQTAA